MLKTGGSILGKALTSAEDSESSMSQETCLGSGPPLSCCILSHCFILSLSNIINLDRYVGK